LKNNFNGFTVLELLVIILVLSAIALIAVPNIKSSINNYKLSCFERIIISEIRFAQKEASVNWRENRVYFSNTSRMVYVKQGTQITKSDSYPASVKLDYTNFTNNQIEFNEFGNPSKGGSIHISCGKTKHTITVLPVTGRVKLYEYEKH